MLLVDLGHRRGAVRLFGNVIKINISNTNPMQSGAYDLLTKSLTIFYPAKALAKPEDCRYICVRF